jgi:hypothetical protein
MAMSHRERTRLRLREQDGGQRPANPFPICALPASVDLRIEEIVLESFKPADRYSIGDAVQSELTRLFTEQSVMPKGTHSIEIGRVDVGEFLVKQGARAATIGNQVAQAVYQGLNQTEVANRFVPAKQTGNFGDMGRNP